MAHTWWPADVLLWTAVALAYLSAAQYLIDGSRAVSSMRADPIV
jgi:hypothetical protein